MKDQNLFEMCVRMFEDRARECDRLDEIQAASVYANCATILRLALDGNYDRLALLDYYREEEG